jgi:hypothetical protein
MKGKKFSDKEKTVKQNRKREFEGRCIDEINTIKVEKQAQNDCSGKDE